MLDTDHSGSRVIRFGGCVEITPTVVMRLQKSVGRRGVVGFLGTSLRTDERHPSFVSLYLHAHGTCWSRLARLGYTLRGIPARVSSILNVAVVAAFVVHLCGVLAIPRS